MTVPPSPRRFVADPASDDADALAQTGSPGDEQQEVRRVVERPSEAARQFEAGAHGRLEVWGRINSECAGEVEAVDGQLEGAGGQVVDECDDATGLVTSAPSAVTSTSPVTRSARSVIAATGSSPRAAPAIRPRRATASASAKRARVATKYATGPSRASPVGSLSRYASIVERARPVCPTRSRTFHTPSAGSSQPLSGTRATSSVMQAVAAAKQSRVEELVMSCTGRL